MEMLGRASKLLVAPAEGSPHVLFVRHLLNPTKCVVQSELAIGGGSGTPLPEVTEKSHVRLPWMLGKGLP